MAATDDGARYVRQRMLTEVGDAGQARLRAVAVRLLGGTAQARCHAAEYLERAGVTLVTDAPAAADAATPVTSVAIPGPLVIPPALQPAADLLLGALAAVEAVKLTLCVGSPAALPPNLMLLGDD